MTISEKIVFRRIEAGLGQAEAARIADVSKQQWEQWESGKRIPNWKSQELIAKALGITVDVLVSDPTTAEVA